MRLKAILYFVLPILMLATACDLEKDIEVILPEHTPQLVVEGYLQQGKAFRVTVTESSSYFDAPQPPFVPDAEVYITHNGRRIKLNYKPTVSPGGTKYYTHTSTEIMKGKVGDIFGLEVTDGKGRKVTGFTTILPLVPIEEVEWKFNEKEKAYLLTSFQDNPDAANYYRYVTHVDSLNTRPERDFTLDDNLTNGKRTTLGSAYDYDRNDTIIVSLYHIEKQYCDFLNSVDNAKDANGNPFAQPSKIKSSVQGGIGIFTNLVFQRKTVVLH
ncbi:hypothetical protein ABID22_004104 [Pontibacter aydingkolensis]|uniref:DUF4249 domain-containing protein n=1 Tax=Pontibacter aydingkolensis TaxID=1911536 RepID=A0ABS7D0F4_9BACT|nr:DUF4249 domain-containing protein [Pontibacter aydingkolensis]MBW7469336.1 DUF4249 domain-containing protein [Pontibacter aydingkolensis]